MWTGELVLVLVLYWTLPHPARSWRSASHAVGSHDWLPKKKLGPGPPERQDKVDTICTVPLDCGTQTRRRLYPFGARV